jgi:hypothetical protein
MQIHIALIANGWTITFVQGNNNQTIYCPTLADVITQVQELDVQMKAQVEENKKAPKNVVPLVDPSRPAK